MRYNKIWFEIKLYKNCYLIEIKIVKKLKDWELPRHENERAYSSSMRIESIKASEVIAVNKLYWNKQS